MQIAGNPYALDSVGVSHAPETPGVYALHLRDVVVYYGIAEESLRDALSEHHEVERSRLNRRESVTGFTFECPPDLDKRRRQLLFQFLASYGQHPKRNAEEAKERVRASEEGARRSA